MVNFQWNRAWSTADGVDRWSRSDDLGRSAWKRTYTSLAEKFTPTIKLHLERGERVLHLMPFFKRPPLALGVLDLSPLSSFPISPRRFHSERNQCNSRPHCVKTTTTHTCDHRNRPWKSHENLMTSLLFASTIFSQLNHSLTFFSLTFNGRTMIHVCMAFCYGLYRRGIFLEFLIGQFFKAILISMKLVLFKWLLFMYIVYNMCYSCYLYCSFTETFVARFLLSYHSLFHEIFSTSLIFCRHLNNHFQILILI